MDIFETLESEVRFYSRNWDTVFERAAGSTLYSEDGRAYLDFFSGAGALNYGHNNPELLRPLVDYLLSGAIVHSLDMKTPAQRRFLETFQELILKPRKLDYKVMFPGPTGTDSVEAALKLARKTTGRHHILSFTNAFHGMTLGSLSVTGNSTKRQGPGSPLTNESMPYDGFFGGQTPDFLWRCHALEDSGSGVDKPAAVIVETVQGEGGLGAARRSWLRGLSELGRQHNILLIVDEVAGLASQLRAGLTRLAAATEGASVRGRGLLAGIYYPDPQTAGRIAAESFARGLLVETSGPEGEVVKTMPALTISPQDLRKGLDILAGAAESVTSEPVALGALA
jgi:4-aminobutyrate aminotransferase-like enzyme